MLEMMPQQYCLRWKHHHTNVQNMFSQLLEKERFCDVTLYCSPSFVSQIPENGTVEADTIRGVSLRAHRVVLAACSELLATLLAAHEAQGEPVLVIDGAEPKHVRQLLDYMYTGEMNVHHSQLASLLKTAEELRIKGLSDIRWNNKDEPPDCHTGIITTTTTVDARSCVKRESDDDKSDRHSINGGPPPLIKLPSKEKCSPNRKRDLTGDSECASPKRKRIASGTDLTDDDEREQDWRHGSMDITAERVVRWGETEGSPGSWDRREEMSDEEWADAPTDIGSFLHTKLRVDGDNSGDEESGDDTVATSVSGGSIKNEPKSEHLKPVSDLPKLMPKPPGSSKTGASHSRFSDVIKLNEYLLHGRRPQFWEEDYVKRVMEAVRLKELEMKQAAEILGVSYGTLYGRYRDVYGCINRPYRNARDFWGSKGPSDVLDRLQRNEITIEMAAQALGVTSNRLAADVAAISLPLNLNSEDVTIPLNMPHDDKAGMDYQDCMSEVRQYGKMNDVTDFEPIPIKVDTSLKKKPFTPNMLAKKKQPPPDKGAKKVLIGSIHDDEAIPATVITTQDRKNSGDKAWPSIRVASIDTLRGPTSTATESTPTSPTLLMKSRPDLTIVARKQDSKSDEETGT